jgi:glycerol-3-phosphate dehydrogenase
MGFNCFSRLEKKVVCMTISRNLQKAAQKTYDLIIIGGGIYGIMLAFEASRRGLSALLLEKNDFGSATSFNSLKTIHGGLRHLQKLNLKLYYQFVKERQWFLQTFPDFVKPLPVLMPLYGDGLRRPGILGQALLLDKLLSAKWNNGVFSSRHLPVGEILPIHRVKEIFPLVNLKGLKGGAQWYDACMPDSQRLLIEILRNACYRGMRALNYMEAVNISKENHKVTGVLAVDLESHKPYHFHSNVVVNCTGPWARKTAALFDRDFPELFRSSIAWNILFNRKALSTHAFSKRGHFESSAKR